VDFSDFANKIKVAYVSSFSARSKTLDASLRALNEFRIFFTRTRTPRMTARSDKTERHPLILRWREPDNPLPRRVIVATRRNVALPWFEAQSGASSGTRSHEPFDFCVNVQRLVMDIAQRCPTFTHLAPPRILVSVTQARAGSKHGLLARVTPLRFAEGQLIRQRRGVPFHIQRYFIGEHEFLYLMTFCLPRYLDQDFDQKLVTLFHELNHIGPAFDGDLRRHKGRYQFHSHSQRDYDQQAAHCARDYLASRPDPNLHGFLRMNFAQLQQRHGAVVGVVVPRPKIIPLVGAHAAAARVATPPGVS
jgi:hypothetical protein